MYPDVLKNYNDNQLCSVYKIYEFSALADL